MGKYAPATTDAWEVIRRHQEAEKAATREALRVGGTQPFQTTRKTATSIRRIDGQQKELEEQQEALAQQQDALEQVVADLANVVNAKPVPFVSSTVSGGWQPNTGWQTVAAFTVVAPEGKGQFTDQSLATFNMRAALGPSDYAEMRARVVINGEAGMETGLPAFFANQGGQLVWTFSGVAQHVRAASGSCTVEVQVLLVWTTGGGSYSWTTQAQLSASGIFTP